MQRMMDSLIRMRRLGVVRCVVAATLSLGGLATLSGCQADLFAAQQAYALGDVDGAAASIGSYRKQMGDNQHAVIALLESGSILQAAGDTQASNEALLDAESRFILLDENQAARAGDEVLSALTNPQEVAYLGKPYDRVFAPVYRAVNLLSVGEIDQARQALFASQNWQTWSISHYAKLIEEAEETLTEEQLEQNQKIQDDEQLQEQLRDLYGDLDAFEAYEGYSNPFADMLFAVYLMGTQTDRSDGELARNVMRRVAGMNPDNAFVQEALDRADDASRGNKQPPRVHVFFMTGTAPTRDVQRIPLPLFLVVGGGNLNYAGVAFPKLVFNPRYVKRAHIKSGFGGAGDPAASGGRKVKTELIADVDRIVAADFKADLPVQITRTIVGGIAKASAAYAINKSTQGQDDTVRAIVQVATFIYQAAQTQADKRTWATLPKQIQYASLPVPTDGQLAITGPQDSQMWETSTLDPNKTHLVFVRSIGPGIPAWVRHVELQ